MPSINLRALVSFTLFAVVWPICAAAQLADLQVRFEKEPDSNHKARMLVKLGEAQFDEARRAEKAGDNSTVALTLEKFRDNVRAVLEALKKQHPNAEKQPGGYRQLEIQVRKGMREAADSFLAAPQVYRPPLEIVRQDLAAMDDELLKLLFPMRPLNQKAGSAITGERTMKFMLRVFLAIYCLTASPLFARERVPQEKDYLSSLEADKIRDAETTNDRVKLFLTFAEDRLKKFQYELEHPSSNRHLDMLNSLLNAYVGCVDDAADLIQLGIQKQENIRPGVDLMATRTKEFLVVLEKLSTDGAERESYKDNLEDAIDGTRDAMNDAEKAKKKVAPPPVRRKN